MKYLGFSLTVLGVLALVVLHLLHFTMVNVLILSALFLVVAGVVLQVWAAKRESPY